MSDAPVVSRTRTCLFEQTTTTMNTAKNRKEEEEGDVTRLRCVLSFLPSGLFSPVFADYKSQIADLDRQFSSSEPLVRDQVEFDQVPGRFNHFTDFKFELDSLWCSTSRKSVGKMASSIAWLSLLVAALAVTAIESRAVSSNRPAPQVAPARNVPALEARDKRQAYQMVYPPRTLMFTSFYRPARQSTAQSSSQAQASGVYAQGNTVGGGAFFQQQPQPQPTKIFTDDGPAPADEPEIAISEAVAAPERPGAAGDEEQEQYDQPERVAVNLPEENTEVKDEASVSEDPTLAIEPPKITYNKNSKKIPVAAPEDDEEYDDDEEIEAPVGVADDPFRPPNKNRKNKPYNFNNFFPVVFTFPAGAANRRAGSPGSGSGSAPGSAGDMPGFITAIANSYSTSKGGVASSVATAYGGMPTKKQRRTSAATN